MSSEEGRWILVPGTLCTAQVFDGFLDAIGVPPNKRLSITIDKPSVYDFGDRLEDLIRPGDTVCGLSLGSIICAHNADRLSKARQLVLIGINPYADAIKKREGRLAFCEAVKSVGAVETLKANPPALFGDNQTAALDAILTMAAQTEEHIDAQTTLALSRPSVLGILAKAAIPVLALTGDKDQQTTPDMGREAANAAPRGQSIEIPNAGHYALLEAPLACASAYRAALDHETEMT